VYSLENGDERVVQRAHSRKSNRSSAPTPPRRTPGDKTNSPTYDLLPGKWDDRFTIAGFSTADGLAPVIFDLARTPLGKLLAVGAFEFIGAVPARGIAQLDHEGWRADRKHWDRARTRWGFSAIAVNDQGTLALSTYAGSFGGANEVWLSVRDRIQVIGQLNGSIRSLVWFKGQLWAAGSFELSSGLTHLAVWNGSTWQAPAGGAVDAPVYRLSVSGGSLFAIGDFSSIGGISAQRVAEWNGSYWRAYDLTLPGIHAYAIHRTRDGRLFAGGAFFGGIAQWNGSEWQPVDNGVFVAGAGGVVSDIVEHKGHIYVSGCFDSVRDYPGGKNAVVARNIARWNDQSGWQGLDDGSKRVDGTWFSWGVCGGEISSYSVWDMLHQRLFSDSEHLYLGGFFGGVAGVASQGLVSFDGSKWRSAGRTQDGLFGTVQQIAAGGPNNDVYVLGAISHAGRTPAHGFQSVYSVFKREGSRAARHTDGWTLVGEPIPDNLACQGIAVERRGGVYLACNDVNMAPPTDPGDPGPGPGNPGDPGPKLAGFGQRVGANAATSGEQPVVFRLKGNEWQQLPTEGLAGTIYDIRIDNNGEVWIAGGVRGVETNTGSSSSGFIARLDNERFIPVETRFDSIVFKIVFPPQSCGRCRRELIAGGAFSHIGGLPFAHIARLEDERWQPLGAGSFYEVSALAWTRGGIYASSQLPAGAPAEDPLQWVLAHWDGKRWSELAKPEHGMPVFLPGTYRWMADLMAYGDKVIAVGTFLPVGSGSQWPDTGAGNVLVVDGTKVSVLGGGIHASYVGTVTSAGKDLWFGGLHLGEVGAGKERKPSVGIAHFVPKHQ
jgi:hypothetical protein